MISVARLEPMFLNPIDAAFHASMELGRIQNNVVPNMGRLQSILEALTDRSLRASGAIYGMTPLASRETYRHIVEIDKALDTIDSLFGQCGRSAEKISKGVAATLKENCERVHEHYQAAKWVEERSAFSR